MTIRGLTRAIVGIVAFAIVGAVITATVTGTDTGSVLIRSIMLLVLAAAIIIGVVSNIGGSGG